MNDSKLRETSAPGSSQCLGWGQRVGAFARLPALIRQLGAEPVTMLARAGITCEAIADPENRVPYQALVTLLHEAAHETACPHIGLLLGRTWHLGDVGVVGEAVRHSPSVDSRTANVDHPPAREQRRRSAVLNRSRTFGGLGLCDLPPRSRRREPTLRCGIGGAHELHARAVRPRMGSVGGFLTVRETRRCRSPPQPLQGVAAFQRRILRAAVSGSAAVHACRWRGPETGPSGNAMSARTEQFGLVAGRVPRGAKAAD